MRKTAHKQVTQRAAARRGASSNVCRRGAVRSDDQRVVIW